MLLLLVQLFCCQIAVYRANHGKKVAEVVWTTEHEQPTMGTSP